MKKICPKCKKLIDLEDESIGNTVLCPLCHNVFLCEKPGIYEQALIEVKSSIGTDEAKKHKESADPDSAHGTDIEIKCPKCGKALRLPGKLIGSKVKCPFCEGTFIGAREPVLRLRPVSVASPVSEKLFRQRQISHGEEFRDDTELVNAPSLQSLLRKGLINVETARAVEMGLTAENTGLKSEDLDALRETAAEILNGENAEAIRGAISDIATRAAVKRINISDPVDRERVAKLALSYAFVGGNEESSRRAEANILLYERAGLRLSAADRKYFHRMAAIEVYNEEKRKAQEAQEAAAAEMAKIGPGLMELLNKLEGRELSLLQKDNIESHKKIIRETKTERSLLSARRSLEKYIKSEGLS